VKYLAILLALASVLQAETWVHRAGATFSNPGGGSWSMVIEQDTDTTPTVRVRWRFTGQGGTLTNTSWLVAIHPFVDGTGYTNWEFNSNQQYPAYPASGHPHIFNGNTSQVFSWKVSTNTGVPGSPMSNYATVVQWAPEVPTYKASYELPANDTDRAITYEVRQNGVLVDSRVRQPGAGPLSWNITGMTSNALTTLDEVTPGISYDSNKEIWVQSGSTVRRVGTSSPVGSAQTPVPVTPTTPTAPTSDNSPPVPTQSQNVPSNQIVWKDSTVVQNPTGTSSTSDFTIAAYREGVDKLGQTLKEIRDKPTGGGGTSVDLTATNTRLDSINANTDGLETSLAGINSALADIKTNTTPAAAPTYDTAGIAGTMNSQRDAVLAAAPYTGPASTGNNVAVSGAVAPTFGVTVPIMGTTVKFSLDPADMGEAKVGDDLIRACRPILLFGLVIAFLISCSGTLNVYVAAMGNNNPTAPGVGPENSLPGVVQAKGLVSAVSIALVMVGTLAVLMVFLDTIAGRYGFGIASILNALDLGPLGGIYGVLDRYFPIGPSVALALLAASFPYFVAPVYIIAANVVRALKV